MECRWIIASISEGNYSGVEVSMVLWELAELVPEVEPVVELLPRQLTLAVWQLLLAHLVPY